MALAEEIQALRDRVLAELDSAHDYYTDTKIAWRLVHKIIAAGHKFTIRNPTTGTVRTQTDLADKARGYVAEQLMEATFQQFISTFENFFFDLLRCWLTTYPQSLGGKQVDFKTVLESPDKETVTQLVVTKELNEVSYDRPARWFAYLQDKAKLDCPSTGEIERIAEAKASRDVLVHNRGIASRTYETKAGSLARFKDIQRWGKDRYPRTIPSGNLGAYSQVGFRPFERGHRQSPVTLLRAHGQARALAPDAGARLATTTRRAPIPPSSTARKRSFHPGTRSWPNSLG